MDVKRAMGAMGMRRVIKLYTTKQEEKNDCTNNDDATIVNKWETHVQEQ